MVSPSSGNGASNQHQAVTAIITTSALLLRSYIPYVPRFNFQITGTMEPRKGCKICYHHKNVTGRNSKNPIVTEIASITFFIGDYRLHVSLPSYNTIKYHKLLHTIQGPIQGDYSIQYFHI